MPQAIDRVRRSVLTTYPSDRCGSRGFPLGSYRHSPAAPAAESWPLSCAAVCRASYPLLGVLFLERLIFWWQSLFFCLRALTEHHRQWNKATLLIDVKLLLVALSLQQQTTPSQCSERSRYPAKGGCRERHTDVRCPYRLTKYWPELSRISILMEASLFKYL